MRVEHITYSRKTRDVPARVALPVRSRISGTVMPLASHPQLSAAYVTDPERFTVTRITQDLDDKVKFGPLG
jgi:hypothetical protein